MGAGEIRVYLSHLVTDKNVAASTQNVALWALLFLYRQVLLHPRPEPRQQGRKSPLDVQRGECRPGERRQRRLDVTIGWSRWARDPRPMPGANG